MQVNLDRRIAVLHFANDSVRGGAEEHMLTLLKRLDRVRFKPMLAAHPKLIEMLRPNLPADVDAIPVTLRSPRDFGGAWHFMRILRGRRVDIVHSHMFQTSRLGSPLAWLARVPVIIETPHVREYWRHGWIKGNYFVDRFVGRFVTAYIAVSAANGKYLANEKRLPADKIVVIRNGVPVERFDPERVPPPEMHRLLGIGEGPAVALVLARLEPQKGHRVLLDAWRSVVESFPKGRLVCAGDGRLSEELEADAAALGIAGSVSFVGYQSNVPDWLALADFTVLPSFYEGLPLAAIESLAAARAVIATSVDGTPEVVLDGKTGLLVPPGEPAPLGAAICRLLGSPELARSLGSAGRRLVEERFSERRQVHETEALYESALRRRVGASISAMSSRPMCAAHDSVPRRMAK